MPSTVAEIFAASGAAPAGVVAWGTSPVLGAAPEALTTGIYVVALTDNLNDFDGALSSAPISSAAVRELLDARPEQA